MGEDVVMTSDDAADPPEHAAESVEPAEPRETEPRRQGPWWQRASFPASTVVVFLVFALALWVNALVNGYRFNVLLALVGSLPLAVLLARGAVKAREPVRAASDH